MSIAPDLLEILACPASRAPLEVSADGIFLVRRASGLVYPSVNDLPVMLADVATPLAAGRHGHRADAAAASLAQTHQLHDVLRAAGSWATAAGPHPHFICHDCGTVACLPSVRVNIRPTPGGAAPGFAQVSEVLLKGRCDHC